MHTMARPTYNMYERDAVDPVLDVIEQIAHVLRTDPAWLAWGVGSPDPVQVIGFHYKIEDFKVIGTWNVPADWLKDTFDLRPIDVALVPDEGVPGDLVIVKRGVEPNRTNHAYAYAICEEAEEALHVGIIRKNGAGEKYSIHTADGVQEFAPEDVLILGKVIGRIAAT
jgi:hypothetical protein